MRVVISPPARADILDIGRHIGGDSPRAADATMDRLQARCGNLQRLPLRFAVAYPGPPPVHRTSVGSYCIFYTVRADHVRVERILHSARDVTDDLLSS